MAYAQHSRVKRELAGCARAKAGDAQAVVANALEGGVDALRTGVTRGPGVALAKRASRQLEAAAYRLREDDLLEALEALAAKIRCHGCADPADAGPHIACPVIWPHTTSGCPESGVTRRGD